MVKLKLKEFVDLQKTTEMLRANEDELRYFKQLDERQQRLYLGLKAKDIGWHGVNQVSKAYCVNAKTVRQGKIELSTLPILPLKRIRKTGSGPKKS